MFACSPDIRGLYMCFHLLFSSNDVVHHSEICISGWAKTNNNNKMLSSLPEFYLSQFPDCGFWKADKKFKRWLNPSVYYPNLKTKGSEYWIWHRNNTRKMLITRPWMRLIKVQGSLIQEHLRFKLQRSNFKSLWGSGARCGLMSVPLLKMKNCNVIRSLQSE